MRRRFFIGSLFTLLVVSLFGQAVRMTTSAKSHAFSNRPQNAEVAKIKAYHDEIDAWAKAHPTAVRYFSSEGEISNDNKTIPHWKEYKTKKEWPALEGNPAQTNASVWMKDGKVVATIFSSKTEHTSNTDGYYYRADGTVAYEEVHGYSLGLDPPYMWSKSYYSSDGKRISMTMLCSADYKKWTPCKKDSGWSDSSGEEHYMKNTDLPFYNLLAKGQ